MLYLIRNLRFAHRLHNILVKHAIPLNPTDDFEPEEEDSGFSLEQGYTNIGPYMEFVGQRSGYVVFFPHIFGGLAFGESEEDSVTFTVSNPLRNKNALNVGMRYAHGDEWLLQCYLFEETPETARIVREIGELIPNDTDENLPPDVGESEGDPNDEEPDSPDDPLRIYCDVNGVAALKILEYLRDTFLSIK